MEKLRVKVCGLRDNIEEVADLRPDYLGFIFYPKSPRYVGQHFVMPDLDSSLRKVGVFVNASVEEMIDTGRRFGLDFIQLHGDESQEACQVLSKEGFGIIKAFHVDRQFDFNLTEQYHSTVDYFLFDTKTEAYGGSGKTFDWEMLNKYKLKKPFFLSGGIGLDNLDDLQKIDWLKVHALDVNSKFEKRPGLKDIDTLRKLFTKKESINSKIQMNFLG